MAQEDMAYVGNAGRGSQVLSQALGTMPSVVKPRLPTGPKPMLAPNQIGNYAGVPVPSAPAPGVAEPDIGKIAALRGSKDEEAVLGGLSRATEEQYKASAAAATLAQKAENDQTERAAKASRDIVDKAKVIASQEEAQTGKFKEFVPTQANAKELGALFSLLTVAAFGAGGQGRYAGMMAMKNMSGALQGYKEGRTDLFNKELKEYDKNFAAMKANNDVAQKTYDRAMKLLALDKEAGLAEMAHLASLDNNGVVAMQIRAHDWEGVGKSLETRAKAIRLSEEKRDKLAQEAQIKANALQSTQESRAATNAFREASLDLRRQGLDAAATRRDEKKTATDRKIELPIIQGIRSVENLQAQLRDPEVQVGLKAKAAPWVQKLKSLGDSAGEFEQAVNRQLTGNDKTTVFLKDALLATYEIERAAKGNQRLTVQDMKMVGPVLDPTNYNPQTYNQILEGRRRTLYNNAQDLGMTPEEIKSRSAQRPYEPYSGSTPKDSEAYSDAEKERRYQEWKAKNP